LNWFIDVAFVCGILIGAIIAYASSRGFFANTTTWKRYFLPPIPTIFFLVGLILLVYGLIVNDREGAMLGAIWFLASFPSSALRKHIMLTIFHRLCVLAVGVLGYYAFRLSLWGIFMLIFVAAGLVDAIHLIIRRKPLGFPSRS